MVRPFEYVKFMNRFQSISALLDVNAGDGLFTSVYLDTRANETGKKNFDVFLKKQITEHLDPLASDSEERKHFEADAEKIREFVDSIDPATQGSAIFASAAAGFFKTFEFRVPFDEDLFFVFDRPHQYPLIKLISQHRRFAVAQADTNSAHIYVFKRGEVYSVDDIQNVKTNRSEAGGWSQMRYQRHIENFHQQHAKEIVAELEKLVRDERVETVILAGDETGIIPLLKAEISKELEEKVIGVLPLNVNAPEHEVLDAAESLVKRQNTLKDLENIKLLEEQNYNGGRGVAGIGKVLAALLNGQVQELYISSDLNSIDYNIGEVNKIFKDYGPGIDQDLPVGLVDDDRLQQEGRNDLLAVVIGLGVVDFRLAAAEHGVNQVDRDLGQFAGVLEDGRALLAGDDRLHRGDLGILAGDDRERLVLAAVAHALE